jgi:hypothetical protein
VVAIGIATTSAAPAIQATHDASSAETEDASLTSAISSPTNCDEIPEPTIVMTAMVSTAMAIDAITGAGTGCRISPVTASPCVLAAASPSYLGVLSGKRGTKPSRLGI